MIFVNFKTYEQGTGESAVALVKVLEQVALDSEVKIIPVLQPADVKEAVENCRLEIWVQHIDPVTFGAHTGFTLPEAVFEDGAMGTFLNHSEHKFEDFNDLKSASERAKKVGLKTLTFAADINELERILTLAPTFVAYEPPELVGSKETSVAKSKPDVIAKAVEVTRKVGIPLVVGAGIKDKQDVRKSIELGAVGVAVASDIVKSEDARREILELIEGLK